MNKSEENTCMVIRSLVLDFDVLNDQLKFFLISLDSLKFSCETWVFLPQFGPLLLSKF